jgi:hypothetical protein
MTFKLLDRARMSVSGAPGTGNITLGVATTGYQTFFQAGCVDGDEFPYSLIDGNNWEYGIATYIFATNSISRAVGKASDQTTNPLNLGSRTVVTACVRAEDVAGNSTLAGLSDVNITPGAGIDGQVVYWNNTDGRFETKTVSGGGGGATTLSALTDVNVTEGSGIDGWTLNWHNSTSKWIAVAPVSGGGGGATTLSALTDVNVTEGSGIDGYTLNWNNSAGKWEAVAPVSGGGGGGSSLTISNNGTVVDSAATTINFVNATSITTSSHDVTVTLPTGGGGGGSTGDWVTLTFGGTSSSLFGGTYFTSNETVTVTDGDLLEIESYIHKSSSVNAEAIASADGSTGYSMNFQSDGNIVLYRYTPSQGALSAHGGTAYANMNGYVRTNLGIQCSFNGSTQNNLYGDTSGWYANFQNETAVSLVGSVHIYLATSDITKSKVRVRVVNDANISTIF